MNEIRPTLGIIGGSGLYQISGLDKPQEINIDTPFGKPSAPIIIGYLGNAPVAFLARHGIGHHISPSEVNYRANMYAMKILGVERIIGISACGSLREEFAPGSIVIPDQIFDFTKNRKRSFFGDGLVAHIGVADPYCPDLSHQLASAVETAGGVVHRGGTFLTIEGPRFSTRAESNVFRTWGMSIIGMTASPEIFLAREAEMCYATMAHVTDYDVWHQTEEPVSVEVVIAVLNHNTDLAQQALHFLVENLSTKRACDCSNALSTALITNPNSIPPETRQRLNILVDKYLK
jgi:5'-methylthioadenosine phosphorylase